MATAKAAIAYTAIENGRKSDRKSTRLNSSHEWIWYAVLCLKKKKPIGAPGSRRTPEARPGGRPGTERTSTGVACTVRSTVRFRCRGTGGRGGAQRPRGHGVG